MKYAAYSEYKISPMTWLDRLPTHWNTASLRWMSKRYAGGTPDKGNETYWEDGEIPWINSGAVNDGYITQPSELITREGFTNSSAKWIPKDALVMALAGQGKTKGMVAQLGIPTTCNQSMAALIPDHRFAPRYLYYWLTANYQNIRNLAGGEARDGLNLEMLGSIPCTVPPIGEQQNIARFLDTKTAQIDTLVKQKRQLIAKLREKCSALIAHTVTRGLPPEAAEAAGLEPNPEMKASPFSWLDLLPVHWTSASLRWMSKRYSGGTPDKGNEAYWEDGEIPWINSGAVNDGYITQASELITRDGFANSSARWIPKDALVMALAGQGKTKGMVAQLGIPTTCNQSMAALVPDHRFEPRYLYYWLTANYLNIRNLAGGEARDGLNLEMLGSIPCPVPPINEQIAIVSFLDKEALAIEQLVSTTEKAIAMLIEYRQALITSAVTGKIDVRELA